VRNLFLLSSRYLLGCDAV